MRLVVDDRERAIIPHFAESYQNFDIEITRVQIGDYNIMNSDGNILFCIERKTWTDLAQSICDGRTENISKMISLRNKTNCKLIYLMEGRARYAATKRFSHIPFKNLQAKLDHLTMRDNVYVIHSMSAGDTVDRLTQFIDNYLTLPPMLVETPIGGGGQPLNDTPKDTDELTEKVAEIIITGEPQHQETHMDILKTTIPKTELQIIYDMWCCIPNITTKTASLFIDAGYHISDLLLGLIPKTTISTMRYSNGTLIGKRADKIIAISQHDRYENVKHYYNILATLPMITKKSAGLILAKFTWRDLLTGRIPIDDIVNVKKTDKKTIGKTAGMNIYKFLVKVQKL
jgi:hypothetical protein